MKRFVGIIAALTLLCSVASAASVTWTEVEGETIYPTYSEETNQVVAIYTPFTDGQATLLAYKVAADATVDAIPAYQDETNTPIVGIDQGTPSGEFAFTLPSTVADGDKIAVMIGGTGLDPISALVTIGTDEEGNPVVETIEVMWGDINGDGSLKAGDATALSNAALGGSKESGSCKYLMGESLVSGTLDGVETSIMWGDINGDGSLKAGDATALSNAALGGSKESGSCKLLMGQWYRFTKYEDGSFTYETIDVPTAE